MTNPMNWTARWAIVAGTLAALWARPVHAQFSTQDGYTPDGAYRVNVELTPYMWLPATSGSLSIGSLGTEDYSSGPPSLADLAHSLHGAVVAFGLVRYGPWSGEVDFQWIDAFHHGNTRPVAGGPGASVHDTVTLTRVAPGFGYEVYSGTLGTVPVTLDARAGFSVLNWNASANIVNSPFSGADVSHGFVQPWLGFRVLLYPWTNWRFEISAIGEGFGVDGGVWGWGASALLSYSVTNWLDVTGGIRALASYGRGNGSDRFQRDIDITAYGPVLGVGFRF